MSLPKNSIFHMVRHPGCWPAALIAACGKALHRKEVIVPRHGLHIKAGIQRGQGLWCAIAGMDYEPELRWLVSRLKQGDTFIDVGANIGIYTLHAARKVGPSGKVLALEPGAGAFALLSFNVTKNRLAAALPIKCAASNQTGEMTIHGNPETWNSLSLAGPGEGGEVVTVGTLTDICRERQLDRVNVIKIDAEGVEQNVLLGGEAIIRRDNPAIIFERTMESEENRPSSLLETWGYTMYSLNGAGGEKSPNWLALHDTDSRKNLNS